MKKLLIHYGCIFFKKKYLFIYLVSLVLTSCVNQPRIHIDNYSGMNVKIDLDNKHWIDVEHSSSMYINSLNDKAKKIRPGKYLITIKANNDEVVDEFEIEIEEDKDFYMLNVGNVMTYEKGRISYSNSSYGSSPRPSQVKERFFYLGGTSLTYIFESPPSSVSTRNRSTSRWYVKRLFISPPFLSLDQFKYEGERKHGMRNGDGKLYNGRELLYDGGWKNDLMSGFGKYTFDNGDEFSGDFYLGSFKEGKLTYYNHPSGMIYEAGEWKDGVLDGYGIKAWEKTEDDIQNPKYEGGLKNGLKQGYGKYWYGSGGVFEGYFDCCSEEKSYQTGVMIYVSGETERGTWQ